MKPIEISDHLFCGRTDFCDAAISNGCEGLSCGECHRKWPTLRQFKEEYGKEVPDHLPMWVWLKDKQNGNGWGLVEAHNIKLIKKTHEPLFLGGIEISEDAPAVCACTPFGKPDKDWRS